MGSWKPSLPWGESTVLGRVAEIALAQVERLFVVVGYRAEDVPSLLPGDPRITVVKNRAYRRGMFSSIQCALPLMETESFVVFLGDMPALPPELLRRLMAIEIVHWARPVYRGKPGHPVRIHRHLIPELLALDPSDGEMRDVLRRYEGILLETGEAGVYRDLDTPEDLRWLTEK